MNEVKVNVRFKTGIIYKTSTKLVTNDYNSTKLIFDFDIPDGIKIFELKDPNDKTIFVDEIKNNEIVLVAKANVTTQKDGVEYIEYTDDKNTVYWYNKESEKLYDSDFLEVNNIKLTDLTKVSKNASLFNMAGDYIFEVSLYNGDSKLTSSHDKLKVIPEQVIVDGEIIETYTPVFENLISDMSEALNEIENLDIDVTKTDDVSTVTITKKDGSTKSVEIKDATINGHNTIEIIEGKNINLEQKGNQLKISSIGGSSEGGVSDYNELDNKPKINGTELKGNLTNKDLGIKNGVDGKDGISVTHSWNGTVLTITSASGTSSSDLKGPQGIQGPKGEQGVKGDRGETGPQGIQGPAGQDGKNGVDGKNYSVEVVESTTTTLEIQPNKLYKFGEVTELNLTLAEITDNTQLNEYMFEFISGATATTLTLPSTVKWLETPTIESNKIYQCSIVDNIGVLLGVANV